MKRRLLVLVAVALQSSVAVALAWYLGLRPEPALGAGASNVICTTGNCKNQCMGSWTNGCDGLTNDMSCCLGGATLFKSCLPSKGSYCSFMANTVTCTGCTGVPMWDQCPKNCPLTGKATCTPNLCKF